MTGTVTVPDVLGPYVTAEGEGIRLLKCGDDGLTITVLVLPAAKYDSWHTIFPKILDRAPKSSFGTSYRLFFLIKDVPDDADTSIRDNEVIMFLGGYGSPFLIGDWIGEPPDELPIITYTEVETLMGIRDRDPKPEVAQNAPAGVVRIGKTKKKTHEGIGTTANLPKAAAVRAGAPYEAYVTPDTLRVAWECSVAYRICSLKDDADRENKIIDEAIDVGRQKYDELSKAADTENAKNGFADILALDSGNGLTASSTELVVAAAEEPKPRTLPPWKREIVINTKFEDCGVARAFSRHRHTFDDEGNACRFEDECGGWFVFDKASGNWLAWQVNHWEPADELVIQAARFVGKSVKSERGEWIDAEKDKLEPGFLEHVPRSANYITQKHMLDMAAANMTVDLREKNNPHLIACRNGIFDSKSGIFYPLTDCDQLKTQYPTVYIDAEYAEGARSEKWINHLETVMTDNTTEGLPEPERRNRRDELVKYLLRLLGYALYAGNPERIFVFFYGCGRNGKSTTTEVLLEIFGDQARKPSLTQLFSQKTDSPAPSIAAALPCRLAVFTEASGAVPMDESAIKEITGETESERFRRMQKDNVKVPIYCLPIATTNDCPTFDKEVGYALLTRLVIIPFKHTFEGEDRTIKAELVADKDKIFSMVVDECREYLTKGLLPVPDCAKMTREELMAGSDRYRFLTEVLEPTDTGRGGEYQMTRNEIAKAYVDWATQAGVDVGTQEKDGDRVLTRHERNKLFAAMRICGYAEVTIKGKRGFRARYKTKVERESEGADGVQMGCN